VTINSKKSSNKPIRLYAHVVLDRSGSMEPCADDAVGGYNAYVAKLPRTSLVSLTLFDSEGIDLIRDGVRPGAAKLKTGDYQPRGMTPLYDAIGHTIAEAERRSVGFERVALVILTDGYENASTDFKQKDILKLLKQKQERDGWLVIYLGANQDAWAVGQQFGAAVGNTMTFDTTNAGFALDSSGAATRRYAASIDAQIGRDVSRFTAVERARAGKPRN
jgi:hypothetical protein